MRHNASKYSVVFYRSSFFKLILPLGIDVPLRSGSSPGTFDHANIRTKSKKSLFISTDSTEKESWYGSTMSPINRCGSPEQMYCTGNCRDNPSEEGLSADVVCVLQMYLFKHAHGHSFLKSRSPCLLQKIVS